MQAGGYSAYYYLSGTATTKYPSIEKTITVPSGTKVGLAFYWGAHLYAVNYYTSDIRYIRVYVNGAKIYEDHVNLKANDEHLSAGWFQASIDLTPYAGKTITLKIEIEEKLNYSSSSFIKSAIDEIILAYK